MNLILLSLCSGMMAVALCVQNEFYTHFSVAYFVLCSVFCFRDYLLRIGELSRCSLFALAIVPPFVFMVLVSLLPCSSAETFWVPDSLRIHHPGALAVSEYFSGASDLVVPEGEYRKVYLTHYWVGLFYCILGAHPFVSILALLVLKACVIDILLRIGRSIGDVRLGYVAILLYVLIPLNFYYGITLRKELMVHLIMAVFVFGAFKLLRERALTVFLCVCWRWALCL